METLKYINLLLYTDIHLQRVKYIINEQSLNINVFLLFLSFVFLQIERERGGYIKLDIWRNGLKVYWSFFLWWSSCGEYFLFHGLIDFMLFLVLAWRTWLLRVRDIFLSSSTRSCGFGSVCHELCPTTNFVFSFFRWQEEGATSVFRVPANHLASTFFLPVSGNPKSMTWVQIPGRDCLRFTFCYGPWKSIKPCWLAMDK